MHEFSQSPVERTVVPFLRIFLGSNGNITHPRSLENLQRQRTVMRLGEGITDSPHENLVTLVNAEVGVTEEYLATFVSGQSDDSMLEYFEGETLPGVPPVAGHHEVVSTLEEIPSMVGLEATQGREFVLAVLGAESIVGGGCRKESSDAKGTSDELVFLGGDRVEESGVEGRH